MTVERPAGPGTTGGFEHASAAPPRPPGTSDVAAARTEFHSDWLDDVVVLNESADERRPGRVSIYRSIDDALDTLEPSWVEDGEYFAYTASGVRLALSVPRSGMVVAAPERHDDGLEVVCGWLEAGARTRLASRRRAATKGRIRLTHAEERGTLPTTVEGLLAYVGFPSDRRRGGALLAAVLLAAAVAAVCALIGGS